MSIHLFAGESVPLCVHLSMFLPWCCFSSDLPLQAWHTVRTQTAEATVVVCVSDVNEPPRWPRSLYVTSVSERPQVDTEIHHLIAVDDDSGSLVSQLHIAICLKHANSPEGTNTFNAYPLYSKYTHVRYTAFTSLLV